MILNEIIERPDMNSCIKTPVAAYNEANNKNQDGDTALYMRLSREDDNMDDESISIGYQRKMLRSFAQEKGFNVYDEYTDDGRRGVTFDRPEFKRMMDDINIGRINNVIVKDLSRFGRNYSDATFLLDDYFPEHGVRLIAIDGSYDGDNDDNEMAPFANFFNEYYSRQTSKKMRRTRKTAANEGKFMGSIPPYGYKRSIADYHKLVIDEEAAEVVRKIFGLFKNGESTRHIADILNSRSTVTRYTKPGKPHRERSAGHK
jgi:DNA invertase Pin-like site-specific DNA recombinase